MIFFDLDVVYSKNMIYLQAELVHDFMCNFIENRIAFTHLIQYIT